jgi:isopentenyl-diphosphate delta-isomerase
MDKSELEKRVSIIKRRKEEGITLCLEKPVQARKVTTLFEDVRLFNDALPEIDFDDIDISTKFLGHKFDAPVFIGAMTGGADMAKKVNKNLAEAAEELGIGMAVGSQRAGLLTKGLAETYSITRKVAPDIFIGSNIGGAQLAEGFSIEAAKKLVEMLDADALYVHLNPLQEAIQPEGEPRFGNVLKRIKELSAGLDKPVIAKEVGAGISDTTAKKLQSAGVAAIEIAGMGGTSWSGVESYRAKEANMGLKFKAGNILWDWGIPTAAALYGVRKAVKLPVVASGGIRNGLEMAKAIAMGADLCAMAWPLLRPATISGAKVKEYIDETIFALKTAMFITGSRNIAELKKARHVITGELKDWCEVYDRA